MARPETHDASAHYDAAFYDIISPQSTASAQVIVPLVLDLAPSSSVIDVGCGRGAWLAVFAAHGLDVFGVDGRWVDPETLLIPRESFATIDLDSPAPLHRVADLAMSLEVAEHLAPESADRFVAFLVALAPVVLFSAAAPQQGGQDHRNEQWPAYWAERFARHGYVPVDAIRPRVWHDPAVAYWYSQNAVLYVRDDHPLATSPPDGPCLPLHDGGPLPLVHPRLAERLEIRITGVTVRGILADVPRIARRAGGAARRRLRR